MVIDFFRSMPTASKKSINLECHGGHRVPLVTIPMSRRVRMIEEICRAQLNKTNMAMSLKYTS